VIVVELWPDIAPCTVNNFLAYVESGRYDGTFIHRSVDGFVIQGGGFFYEEASDTFSGILLDPPVPNEPGASNRRGTIAMARLGGQPDSATSQFFVNLGDNVFLDSVDGGFTVFGEVVAPSMAVVDAIAALPRVEGPFVLNSSLRNVFQELPVQVAPSGLPGGPGCFDPDALPRFGGTGWLRALVSDVSGVLEADPVTGGIFALSKACDGSGAIGSPSVPCTTSRDVAFTPDGQGWFVDSTPMSCAALAESEESLAARRNHFHPQVVSSLVELGAVAVPEPGAAMLLGSGVGALCLLGRRRARARDRLRGVAPTGPSS
jgi:cyclophilin family peptidyl-prolyl cis-trans isomerase